MVQQPDNKRLVVGITGASGSIYGIRLIETLLDLEYNVHLVISNAGWRVLKEELDWDVTNRDAVLEEKFGNRAGSLIYHPVSDIGASIASGSLSGRRHDYHAMFDGNSFVHRAGIVG